MSPRTCLTVQRSTLPWIDDDLDDDRPRLHAALKASEEEFKAGKGIPAAEVIAELRRG